MKNSSLQTQMMDVPRFGSETPVIKMAICPISATSLVETTTKTTVAIFGNPHIPCHIQTTHEWRYHLDPYLRRRDIDVNVVEASDLTDPVWQDAHIQIIWKGETIETPMQLIVND